MSWTVGDIPDQSGRTFVVTGANAGIGLATARLLASRGARVVMACRDLAKGERALAQLRAAVPQADADLMQLDLADLASVRRFAADCAQRHAELDVLINNAGVMVPPLLRTADGFELQFGTNVLGHFALTGLLLPLLERRPGARVVTLGSVAHWVGRIDFDNLNAEKGYWRWPAYAQSKLADILFAYELERRLRRVGSATVSLAAHPGATRSELGRHSPGLTLLSGLAQPAEDGALPSLRAAVDPQARGGEYYGPARRFTTAGPAVRQRSSRRSHDAAVAARLWTVCEQLTGVRYPG